MRRVQRREQGRRGAGGAQGGVLRGSQRLQEFALGDLIRDVLLVFAGAEEQRELLESDGLPRRGGGESKEAESEENERKAFSYGSPGKGARGIP